MLITINILSAMSIVMALFIPYFILLHINNKLRKELECAVEHIVDNQNYSEITRKRIVEFAEVSNENFEGQDKNWENYHEQLNLIHEALSLCNENFKGMEENFNYIINEIDDLNELLSQKQTLKQILETPIEVKKPACETKVNLMGKVKPKRKYTKRTIDKDNVKLDYYKHERELRKTTVTKCKNCETEFLAKSTLAKFCGSACKQENYNKNNN